MAFTPTGFLWNPEPPNGGGAVTVCYAMRPFANLFTLNTLKYLLYIL
jgi:hypothetical protein